MERHRRTRRNLKKQRKIIVISLIVFLFIMVGSYAAFRTNLDISAKGNIVEKSRVVQNWTATSQEDFHSDYYRENIVSATFLDNNNVPNNAVESWNVSEDKNRGGVMAWVIQNSEDNTKYDLFIGAKDGVIANEDSGYLFMRFSNMTEINFDNNFDTRNVTNMYGMFVDCLSLTSLDLSTFDTSKVTNMHAMFMNSNVNMVSKLEEIIFGTSFRTNNVTDMYGMFGNLTSLVSLDLSIFDTSSVTNMNDMFSGCQSLTLLDVSSFNTSNVTTMAGMFYNCKSLTELNLCSFDTNKVSNMRVMFAHDNKLSEVKVGPNWTTTDADTSNMFYGSGVSSVTTGQCQ